MRHPQNKKTLERAIPRDENTRRFCRVQRCNGWGPCVFCDQDSAGQGWNFCGVSVRSSGVSVPIYICTSAGQFQVEPFSNRRTWPPDVRHPWDDAKTSRPSWTVRAAGDQVIQTRTMKKHFLVVSCTSLELSSEFSLEPYLSGPFIFPVNESDPKCHPTLDLSTQNTMHLLKQLPSLYCR